MTNTLHIKNELKQLTRLYAFLDQQAGTYELGELQSMQIKLALEEADKKDQDIRIDMSYENKRLTIVITDTGISFNPLERQEPDLTLSLEERPTGGLGIYLVKQLMTEVSYSRSAGKNILTMAKDIC